MSFDWQSLEKIGEGTEHEVFVHPHDQSRVLKIPRKSLLGSRTYREIVEELRVARGSFGRWIAETAIEKEQEHGYVIHQRRLHGPHLNPSVLVDGVFDEYQELLADHHALFDAKGIGVDFIGLEGAWKCILSHMRSYRCSLIDTLCIAPFTRMASGLGSRFPNLLCPRNASELWSKSESLQPELTNILVNGYGGNSRALSIVDFNPLIVRGVSFGRMVRARIVNAVQNFFMERYFVRKV